MKLGFQFSNKKKENIAIQEIIAFLEKCQGEENPIKYMEKVLAGVEQFEAKTGIVNSTITEEFKDIEEHKNQFCALVVNFYLETKEKTKSSDILTMYYNNIRHEGDTLLKRYKELQQKL